MVYSIQQSRGCRILRVREFLQEVITMKTKTGVKAGNSSYFVEWIPNN